MARTKRIALFVAVVAGLVIFAYSCLEKCGEWQWQHATKEIDKEVKAFIDSLRDGRVSVNSAQFMDFEKVFGPIDEAQLLKDVKQDYEMKYGYRTGCAVDVSVCFREGGELVLFVGENRFRSLFSFMFCFWGRYSVSVIKYVPRRDNEKIDSGPIEDK